jgi:NAD(P)-dependent dehydrogenase (short-subunit alcohol dehydrogenase family)
MDLQLQGKSVLITGASKGIGAAVATTLAAEGCSELHLAARNAPAMHELAARLQSKSDVRVHVHSTDLREGAQLDALAQACQHVDLLINNAGDIPGGRLTDVDAAAWRRGWELKVLGTIDLTRRMFAFMQDRSAGVILNIIGVGGERLQSDYIAGASGNAALMGFTKALGSDSLNFGIRVVGVNPGAVSTERIVTLMRTRAAAVLGDEERWRELMKTLPMGRAAEPAEIADLVAFLVSPRAAYISGSIHTIDGGAAAGLAGRG